MTFDYWQWFNQLANFFVWMCEEQKRQLNFTRSLDSDSVTIGTEIEVNSDATQSWTQVASETAASLNT